MNNYIKLGIGLLGLIIIVLGFQNCGEIDVSNIASEMPADQSLQYASSSLNDDYNWKCIFTLQGPKGATWKSERHLKTDDKCKTAQKSVAVNNPKASVLDVEKIFMGYHNDQSANPYNWRCSYTLQGSKGAQWDVERYMNFDDGCKAADKTVAKNNPKAKVIDSDMIFIGYDNSDKKAAFNWKCKFTLQGPKGYSWDVVRYSKTDDRCSAATNKVTDNNPNAVIISTNQIYVGYN